MKRVKKKFEAKAWQYENMYPNFVSIVKSGANWIPFSTIKFSEDSMQEFTDGYEVSKVVFSSTYTETQAKTYLDAKGFTDYTLEHSEDGSIFVENNSEFTDVKEISMGDVTVFIGKTNNAAQQVKTKIEEAEPVMKLEDSDATEGYVTVTASEDTNVDLEDSVKEDATEPVSLEESSDTETVVEEETSTEEDKVEDEPSNEDDELNFSNSEVKSFSAEEADAIVKAYMQLKFSEQNSYLLAVQARKAYMAINTLSYSFMDDVYEALTKEEDFSMAVKKKCSDFGDAVVAVYSALSDIQSETSVVSATEEFSAQYSDEDSNTDTVNDEVLKLQEKVELLTGKIVELENSTKGIDNEVILQQYSKADVSAFDKSSALEETTQPKPLTTSAKNLFGI